LFYLAPGRGPSEKESLTGGVAIHRLVLRARQRLAQGSVRQLEAPKVGYVLATCEFAFQLHPVHFVALSLTREV